MAKQRVSDILGHCPDPTWEATFKLLALMDIKPSEVMMTPDAGEPAEPERQSTAA